MAAIASLSDLFPCVAELHQYNDFLSILLLKLSTLCIGVFWREERKREGMTLLGFTGSSVTNAANDLLP